MSHSILIYQTSKESQLQFRIVCSFEVTCCYKWITMIVQRFVSNWIKIILFDSD